MKEADAILPSNGHSNSNGGNHIYPLLLLFSPSQHPMISGRSADINLTCFPVLFSIIWNNIDKNKANIVEEESQFKIFTEYLSKKDLLGNNGC